MAIAAGGQQGLIPGAGQFADAAETAHSGHAEPTPAHDQGGAGNPAVDTVTDFGNQPRGQADGDVLDLRELLVGELHTGNTAGNLGNYLHFAISGGSTTLQISTRGAFDGTNFAAAQDQVIVLPGIDLSNAGALASDVQIVQDLLTRGRLQAN